MYKRTKEQRHTEYLRSRDKNIKRAAKWNRDNPEKRKIIMARNNARSVERNRLWHELKMFGVTIKREECRMCGVIPIRKADWVVHHTDGNNGRMGKPLNNNPLNLVVLCRKCHAKVHPRDVIKEIVWS